MRVLCPLAACCLWVPPLVLSRDVHRLAELFTSTHPWQVTYRTTAGDENAAFRRSLGLRQFSKIGEFHNLQYISRAPINPGLVQSTGCLVQIWPSPARLLWIPVREGLPWPLPAYRVWDPTRCRGRVTAVARFSPLPPADVFQNVYSRV